MSLREQGESEALVVLDDMILAGVYYDPIFYDAEGNNERPGIYMSKDETTDFYAYGLGMGEIGAIFNAAPSENYGKLFKALRKDGILVFSPCFCAIFCYICPTCRSAFGHNHPDDYKRDFIFDTKSEAGNRNLAGYGNTGGRRSKDLSD